ncbi:ABC transporter permease [Rummeliibacillus pycnus]|uniref:ABC transporter permease n=1 Tax=Rummeliibacillus pycnus TaxID=101070 RepID=UPI000C9BC288|nr:FtsX-like permease family protein [Rummeliibacillus pycnus]
MNFIKRAFYSTKAKKGRTLLLTFVFSAILIFILAGLTIQSASLKATENAKKSMGATVTLTTNMKNAFKKVNSSSESKSSDNKNDRPDPGSFSITPVDLKTINTLAKLDNVSSYSISSSTSVNAKSFDSISSDDQSSTDKSGENQNSQQVGPAGGMRIMRMTAGDITIQGTNSTATASKFTNGTAKIIKGVGITAKDEGTNKAVIETNLAKANNITVGDTIKVTNTENEDTVYKLKVVGIYKSSETADARSMRIEALNPYNAIYTSYTFANKMKGSEYKDTADSVVYTLSDPEKMNTFVKQAKKAGLDTDTYSLTTNNQVYEQMIQPLTNVESFAHKIVILVSVAGTVILALIVILMIRERKYEIGVLLSLGEKRKKIISQFFTELLVVLVIALCIAGISGKFVGNVVGKQLLEQQATTTVSASYGQRGQGGSWQGGGPGQMQGQGESKNGGAERAFANFGASSAAEAKQIKNLTITLSLKELVELGGLGLAISFLAIIIASIGVMRMQPKKILIS